jgi:hypothetical protein
MNVLQNDQKQVTGHPKDSPATTSVFELMKMAKRNGLFGDLILRFRDGELVAADTGDQGGGQN